MRSSLILAAALVVPPLAEAQVPRRILVPGAQLERAQLKDTRPTGPAPAMIYAKALSPTTAKVTYARVPKASGYQLYRSTGGAAPLLVNSVAVDPNLVLAYDPTAYSGPPPGVAGPRTPGVSGGPPPPGPVPYGGTGGVSGGPPMTYTDPGRSPKASYTYSVVATYPDSSPYRPGSSEPTTVTMPPGLAPVGLTASTSMGTTVTLHWEPAPDATGYTVFRNNTPITAQPVRGTSYVDPGLQPGLYSYSVTSFYRAEGLGEIPGELNPRASVEVILSRCARP
jgi:hypothetical protein